MLTLELLKPYSTLIIANQLPITLTLLIAKAGLPEKPKEDAPKPAAAAAAAAVVVAAAAVVAVASKVMVVVIGAWAGGMGGGCSARHEGLVVPARLVESAVGICAEMSVAVLHDQLVGGLVHGVGCSRPSVVGRPVVRAGPSGQQQQQTKAEHGCGDVGAEAGRRWRVTTALLVRLRKSPSQLG